MPLMMQVRRISVYVNANAKTNAASITEALYLSRIADKASR